MTAPHFPTDYDEYAPTYAWTRRAVPWVVEPLATLVGQLDPGATVLEIGCGTGNDICALAAQRADLGYVGFDVSEPMLLEARKNSSILAVELARYPTLDSLHREAAAAGLQIVRQQSVSGSIPLDDEFLERLAAKCSSALRLISPEAYAAGMARVREAHTRRDRWLYCYTVLEYGRRHPL